MPSSRDAIVHRLRGTQSAYTLYTGKPKVMLAGLLTGEMSVPKDFMSFDALERFNPTWPDEMAPEDLDALNSLAR
jgi:hypothetical protein